MKIRASIDLGTNTCLLLIVEWDPHKKEVIKVLQDEARVVRLGQGVDQSRLLHPDAMERVRICLKEYAAIIKEKGATLSETVAVATSQARDCSNSRDFFKKILDETGISFQVLSGQDEARYTFLGALISGFRPEECAVIDIGGGSTEYTVLSGGISLDMGSVRFTERYFKSDPVTDSEFWRCESEIDRELEKLKSWREKQPKNMKLIGVAGTVTTLATYHLRLSRFDSSKIHGLVLSVGDIHRMVEELKFRSVKERLELPGIEPGRADVLLAGSLILWRSMEVLGYRDLTVSTRGLRYGVLSINA